MDVDNQTQIPLPNVDRMIRYCTGVADEFLARLNRIRSFVPEHNLTSGTANEMLLRDFLSEYSNGKFALGQGFICDPTIPDQATHHLVSKQCDIIVYNRDYPLVHSEGAVKVVWPQAVRMVIEIKTKLNKKDLFDALDNICAAKQVAYMNLTHGLIFAFKSSTTQTIVKHLREYDKELSINHSPTAILLLDRGTIIHRWNPVESDNEIYQVREGVNGKKAVVMAFLVMFFFDILLEGLFGGSSISNMLRRMLEYRTISVLEDFKIGEVS